MNTSIRATQKELSFWAALKRNYIALFLIESYNYCVNKYSLYKMGEYFSPF